MNNNSSRFIQETNKSKETIYSGSLGGVLSKYFKKNWEKIGEGGSKGKESRTLTVFFEISCELCGDFLGFQSLSNFVFAFLFVFIRFWLFSLFQRWSPSQESMKNTDVISILLVFTSFPLTRSPQSGFSYDPGFSIQPHIQWVPHSTRGTTGLGATVPASQLLVLGPNFG